MRNLKVGLADLKIIIEQNVEVERARTVEEAGAAVAAKLVLDPEQFSE